MIVLLYADGTKDRAESIANDILSAFKGRVELTLMPASSPSAWSGTPDWNDLLVIAYDEKHFPDSGNDFVAEYSAARQGNGLLLPVALNLAHTRPPRAAEAIKALNYDASAHGVNGRLVRRVGAMLGFRVQKRDNKIFISYRATDGTRIAEQLEKHLKEIGYPVWRDDAKELDGDTQIFPGSQVQLQIDDALKDASILLLLDTPKASDSPWITHEVETANGLLLPVLPVCFRVVGDSRKKPRFRSLSDLQRWVLMTFDPLLSPPLTEMELNQIVDEMEGYICEIFQRKCRVPYLVEKEFTTRSYEWKILDEKLLMCESTKKHSVRLTTRVLSHCSIFEQVYEPALQRFCQFLSETAPGNHSLYIYGGEVIPEPQLNQILQSRPADENVIILHHQELAALIDSNFTTFA